MKVNERERKKETDNDSELKRKKETDRQCERKRKKEKEIKGKMSLPFIIKVKIYRLPFTNEIRELPPPPKSFNLKVHKFKFNDSLNLNSSQGCPWGLIAEK